MTTRGADLRRLWSAILLSIAALLPLPAADVKLPPYERRVFSNGLVLNLVPHRDVPLVTIRVVIKGGMESDPENLAGLSHVTAELIRRGTNRRTADQFSEELDSLGATWTAAGDEQSTVIQMESLSKDLDKSLDLMLDVLRNPTFPKPEFDKHMARRIDAARSRKDSPQIAAGLYYRAFFFGQSHPYGRVADEVSLAHIRREDVLKYHHDMYTGKNMIVVVSGDIGLETMPVLTRAFSRMRSGAPYRWKTFDVKRSATSQLAIVDKPGATQTSFYIGQPGVSRCHPDRTTLALVNTVFGGRFTSLLMQTLRTDAGLTYGAHSRVSLTHMPGAITINASTDTATTVKAVDMALEVLSRFHEQGISSEQLASAKSYYKGIFPSERLETADQIAELIAELELNDLSRSDVDDLFARIDAVTVDDANRVIRTYYQTSGLTFLLLGNAAQFRLEALKYAPAESLVEVPISRPGIQFSPTAGAAIAPTQN